MDEQKRPTSERRRLILMQDAPGKPTLKGLLLILRIKAENADVLLKYSIVSFCARPLGFVDAYLG